MQKENRLLGHLDVKGFTLTELLVVVLLIGILAAVALPQYQIAVLRARFSQVVTAVNALKESENRYWLANGTYTMDRDNLDIEFAGSNQRFPTVKYQLNLNGVASCGLEGTGTTPTAASNVYCRLRQPVDISLGYYLTTQNRMCCNFTLNNTYADKLCQREVGSTSLYDDTPDRRCYYGK